jgi:hypothetical protein
MRVTYMKTNFGLGQGRAGYNSKISGRADLNSSHLAYSHSISAGDSFTEVETRGVKNWPLIYAVPGLRMSGDIPPVNCKC